MSMLRWVKKDDRPNLIVFIHGLKGGVETWSYDDNTSFPNLFKSQTDFISDFDIACFDYFTTFTETYGKAKGILRKLFTSFNTKEKNLPIDELSELLKTEIDLTDYQNIILIAHSMGGLVAKSCILKQLEEKHVSNIRGLISLAVPHSGALIANIGGLVSNNVQLQDLSVLSPILDKLNRDWIHTANTPCATYIYASHDDFVKKESALAVDALKNNIMAINADHSSICKPRDVNESSFRAVKKHIEKIKSDFTNQVPLQALTETDAYSNEYFVIKMVLADIHNRIQGHAKEYFYNAELARKIFTSESDRKKLEQLYSKIRCLYQEELEAHIADDTITDKFITSVHQRITDEDERILNQILGGLDSVHKKGMLHQLSNKFDTDIIWDKNTSISQILASREGAHNEL
ncbi:MAG: alpha/beta hydrolase [Gammaproteobacteria bacterium]|nr:alpha/beta hydrolase [Gammaproteobacteria bacterium]MBU1479408.1 alpha/beta hydrolase [Gammaproteobacteria bacterium]MBU2002116.1 alpha/beta hydrolase [Gammaproteobacteria bacterium]MBU2187357.1 alpha/beta hydrolase [Gammaproteobacteria bacterium]MBU2297471.1 alpha/beta hydrolase [Gammaproteobacteria bacterium]